jgi:hypothetical protein
VSYVAKGGNNGLTAELLGWTCMMVFSGTDEGLEADRGTTCESRATAGDLRRRSGDAAGRQPTFGATAENQRATTAAVKLLDQENLLEIRSSIYSRKGAFKCHQPQAQVQRSGRRRCAPTAYRFSSSPWKEAWVDAQEEEAVRGMV